MGSYIGGLNKIIDTSMSALIAFLLYPDFMSSITANMYIIRNKEDKDRT